MSDEIDWSKVKVRKVEIAGLGRTIKRRIKFVGVPWEWAERLKVAKNLTTYRVAIHLLSVEWRNPGQPIRLSNAVLRSVSRPAKRRALRELTDLDLVVVDDSSPGRAPLVKLKRVRQ